MTNLATAIKSLERMRDSDGTLKLDRDQATFLIFLLWDIFESAPKDIQFATLDLLGVLPSAEERGA